MDARITGWDTLEIWDSTSDKNKQSIYDKIVETCPVGWREAETSSEKIDALIALVAKIQRRLDRET